RLAPRDHPRRVQKPIEIRREERRPAPDDRERLVDAGSFGQLQLGLGHGIVAAKPRSPRARASARALARHSSYSAAAFESATIPPPTRKAARSPRQTSVRIATLR